MRRLYPYGINRFKDGGWMPVRPDNSDPWGFTYEDDEDDEDDKQLDRETLEGAPNPNQVSMSKPVVKDNTGTDLLTTLSSLEQMGSKLLASDQATLSAIRSKEEPQSGSKGTADIADLATLTTDDVDTILKQMVDKLAERDRKTFDDLQSKSATRLSAATILTAGTAAPSSVDPNHVLGHMIRKLCKDSTRFPRYSEMLHDINIEDMQSRLAGSLCREAWDVCANGSWSHESLSSIGGDLQSRSNAVYMHVFWLKADPKKYWLYVGQAGDLKYRVDQHEDPAYRATHPCLHYSMFDPLTMESAYVILAEAVPPEIQDRDLCLNMLEMWGCLLFQTLQEKDLSEWLDPTNDCPSPGQHLNIALPLHQQRVSSIHIEDHRGQFGALRLSTDKAKQDYFWQVVRAHHALRNSRDPRKRAAYWKHRDIASKAVHQHRARETKIRKWLEGMEVNLNHDLRKSQGGYYFNCLSTKGIVVPQSLDRRSDSPVIIQLVLADGDERHPHCYALRALDEDPAKRLAFRCTYQSVQGSQEQTWLKIKTEKAVYRINTLVDTINNIPTSLVRNTSRRHCYVANDQPWIYTSEVLENGRSSDTSGRLKDAQSTPTAPLGNGMSSNSATDTASGSGEMDFEIYDGIDAEVMKEGKRGNGLQTNDIEPMDHFSDEPEEEDAKMADAVAMCNMAL